MIKNLPESFPLEKLDDFNLGNVEATIDELLDEDMCICRIRPINEFLKGKKTIVVGERGSGKTALFKLLNDKKLTFKQSKSINQLIVGIDDELQFKTLNKLILSRIKITSEATCLTYRFVWELFILYRILISLETNCSDTSPIKDIILKFREIFGSLDKTRSLLKFVKSQKKTIGCKVDSSASSVPIPDFYFSVEPNEEHESSDDIYTLLNLYEYKKRINEFLSINSVDIYILIDKLDEFVLKEEYEIQKQIIQGLLFSERDYLKYSNLKLKIFLRSDIFNKLNFDELGYEKVSNRKIDLSWSHEDIREFLSRRIAYNFLDILKMNYIEFEIDKELLHLDETSADRIEEINTQSEKDFLRRVLKFLSISDSYSARKINFIDKANREMITSIFPKQLSHKDIHGNRISISIFKYLSTHLNLCSGKTTPRISAVS